MGSPHGFIERVFNSYGYRAVTPGADPGFQEGGFKSIKRGFVFNILPNCSKISPRN